MAFEKRNYPCGTFCSFQPHLKADIHFNYSNKKEVLLWPSNLITPKALSIYVDTDLPPRFRGISHHHKTN